MAERTAASGNELALAVKEADLRDNLRDIAHVGGPSLERRYQRALEQITAARAK